MDLSNVAGVNDRGPIEPQAAQEYGLATDEMKSPEIAEDDCGTCRLKAVHPSGSEHLCQRKNEVIDRVRKLALHRSRVIAEAEAKQLDPGAGERNRFAAHDGVHRLEADPEAGGGWSAPCHAPGAER